MSDYIPLAQRWRKDRPRFVVDDTVNKFDPSQPRDWRGRWSKYDDADEAKWDWVMSGQRQYRSALSEGRDPKRYHSARAAIALLNEVNRQPPTAIPLYRGISLDGVGVAHMASLKVGEKVDLNLSSWTEHQGNAAMWAGNMYNQQTAYEQQGAVGTAVFHLEPGAHAENISDYTNRMHSEGGYYKFTEWLTAGRFEVTSVDSKVTYDRGYNPDGSQRSSTHFDIGLRQVATLKAPDLRYTKMES